MCYESLTARSGPGEGKLRKGDVPPAGPDQVARDRASGDEGKSELPELPLTTRAGEVVLRPEKWRYHACRVFFVHWRQPAAARFPCCTLRWSRIAPPVTHWPTKMPPGRPLLAGRFYQKARSRLRSTTFCIRPGTSLARCVLNLMRFFPGWNAAD